MRNLQKKMETLDIRIANNNFHLLLETKISWQSYKSIEVN
ncbi:unnamed protein product [Paramecium primaurelia]|uniref:Uncharacterized protein n=1 Tax=Paramecium primaurelia TaxID=5886 RepID=A0A8S1Q7U6_PARPR|nr:unnamed protein product [Paramecium primaurelia]